MSTISDKDKENYRLFTQNRARFIVLLEAGVFSLEEGKAEINCHNGQIQIVNIYTRTYKREPSEKGNVPI